MSWTYFVSYSCGGGAHGACSIELDHPWARGTHLEVARQIEKDMPHYRPAKIVVTNFQLLSSEPAPALRDEAQEALVDVAASLAAAISLLERGGKAAKGAAASDRMFDQMLDDYRASLERARAAIGPADQNPNQPPASTAPAKKGKTPMRSLRDQYRAAIKQNVAEGREDEA